jgi:hypothetical protein
VKALFFRKPVNGCSVLQSKIGGIITSSDLKPESVLELGKKKPFGVRDLFKSQIQLSME